MKGEYDWYQQLTQRWLAIRDDPDVSEAAKDAHLELMDEAWWALTDEERQRINDETAEAVRSEESP